MTGASLTDSLDSRPPVALEWSPRVALSIGLVTFVTMLPVTMLVAPLKELIGDRFGAGSFWTHSFMSVNMVGAILATPLIGLLADRAAQRRRIAALALAADGCLLLAMAVVASLPGVLILRFLEGAAHILALTTLLAVAASWAPEGRRGRMMGIVGACLMFGTACGTRLGGLVWRHLPDGVFIVAGVTSLFAGVGVLLVVAEPADAAAYKPQVRQAIATLRLRPRLLVPFAYAFIDRLCVGVVISTFVLFLGDVHELEPDAISRMLLMFLLPFAVLIYPAGRLVDRIGRVWPIVLGSIAFGLVFGAYGYLSAQRLPFAMVTSGILSALMFAPNLALCADLAPAGQRGAVYAGFNAAGSLGFVLGPLLAGGAFRLLSAHCQAETAYRLTFLGAGATEVFCAAITLPLLLRLKRERSVR